MFSRSWSAISSPAVPVRTATALAGVNRSTAILFSHKLRELIATKLAEDSPFLGGEVEVDESRFGGPRKGKRGRKSAGPWQSIYPSP